MASGLLAPTVQCEPLPLTKAVDSALPVGPPTLASAVVNMPPLFSSSSPASVMVNPPGDCVTWTEQSTGDRTLRAILIRVDLAEDGVTADLNEVHLRPALAGDLYGY